MYHHNKSKALLLSIVFLWLALLLTTCQQIVVSTREIETSNTPDVTEIPTILVDTVQPTTEITDVSIESTISIITPITTPTPLHPTPSATSTSMMMATRTTLGGWLAFSSRRQDTNEDGIIDSQDGVHIYSLNLSTNDLTQLTFGNHQDLRPTWSPDGSQIAFVSNREDNFELYMINADGSGLIRLTNTPEWETEPSWSPDGTKIVYVQVRTVEFGLQEKRLYLYWTVNNSTQQLTSGPGNDEDPDWSPDGRYLTFKREEEASEADGSTSRETTIHLLDLHEDEIFKLTSPAKESNSGGFVRLQWLPRDGYFLSMIQVPGDLSSVGIKVFELQWENGHPALYRVFAIADAYGRYTWGPNGEWLISIDSNDLHYGTVSGDALNDLIVLPVDFSTQERSPIADPAAESSFYYSLNEGELVTNNTFYDDYPDWTP